MKRLRTITFIIFLAIILSSVNVYSAGKEYLRQRSGTLPADEESTLAPSGEYYIAAGDVIEIYVWQHQDISREVKIRPDGMLSYPLVGNIKVAGMTIDNLQLELTKELEKYIRYPLVTITVKEFSGNKIIVLGEVNYPGVYTYSGTINLLEALALAGDFTEDGKRESVIVVSGNFSEEPVVRRVDLFKAIRRGARMDEVALKANDLVYVPKHFIGDMKKFWSDYGGTIDRAYSVFGWRDALRLWIHHGDESN